MNSGIYCFVVVIEMINELFHFFFFVCFQIHMVPASPLRWNFHMSAQRLWLWSHLYHQMSTFKINFILF